MALALTSATANVEGAQIGNLSVMTFNIKAAPIEIGFDQQTSWDYIFNNDNDRRARVVSVMSDSAPDIIGVQEMVGGQLEYVQNRLPDYFHYGVSRETGATGGPSERVGVFYRSSRFRLLSSGEFWLSETPDVAGTTFVGNGGDLNNPRMVTWVKLRDLSVGISYMVLNTHWSLDGEARRQSGLLMQDKLQELSDGLPVIIMGDFNETAAGAGFSALARSGLPSGAALTNAYAASGAPTGKTFHGYNGGESGYPIDSILASNDAFVAADGEIIRTTFGGYYPSDHYPVQVLLHVLDGRSPGDFNGDGRTNGADFLTWQRSYGDIVPMGTGADADSDGQITANDLPYWSNDFGAGLGFDRALSVPEPTSTSLLGMCWATCPGVAVAATRRSSPRVQRSFRPRTD
ncbi:MAG: endonuclease/exonuclease/phosphatase family protein [Planctomycetales bacterium]|nr:endonuclease/exonuclease/phosphatase family protein [Planctomycetales bacterium]